MRRAGASSVEGPVTLVSLYSARVWGGSCEVEKRKTDSSRKIPVREKMRKRDLPRARRAGPRAASGLSLVKPVIEALEKNDRGPEFQRASWWRNFRSTTTSIFSQLPPPPITGSPITGSPIRPLPRRSRRFPLGSSPWSSLLSCSDSSYPPLWVSCTAVRSWASLSS